MRSETIAMIIGAVIGALSCGTVVLLMAALKKEKGRYDR